MRMLYFLLISARAANDVRQLRSRHHAVLDRVAGAQPADGAAGHLAALPQHRSLVGRRRLQYIAGAEPLAELDDLFHFLIEPNRQAIDFNDEHGPGVGRKTEVVRLFDGRQNALVHQFQGCRNNAGRDDLAHGIAGVVQRVERRPHGTRVLRIGRQADPDLGHDAERAFAADQHADQIELRQIVDGPKLNDRAVAQYDLDAENVVDRDAVLERVRAAGVGGHVAADGAGALARRVGGVVVACARQRAGEPKVGHSGLDDRHAISEVDLDDSVHARERENDRIASLADRNVSPTDSDWQAAAGQTGSGTAGNHRCAMPLTDLHGIRNLLGGARKHDGFGWATLDREAIAIIDRQLRRRREHVVAAERFSEFGNKR